MNTSQSQFQPQGPDAYTTGATPPAGPQPTAPGAPPSKRRNTVAIVALVVAVAGFVFAVWEGAYLLGWILLPIAFILALVALFGKDKPKKMAVWALIISVVGTIAGAVAFMSSTARILDETFGETTPSVVPSEPAEPTEQVTPDETNPVEETPVTEDETPAEEPASDLGTRDQPLPLGTTIATDEWEVTVNSFTADATDVILAENQFNDPPADGNTYALASVTVTRVAEEAASRMGVSVAFVTSGGNVIETHDTFVVAPDELGYDELYGGASSTGNVVLEIPAGDPGVLRVTPGFFTDDAFIAIS